VVINRRWGRKMFSGKEGYYCPLSFLFTSVAMKFSIEIQQKSMKVAMIDIKFWKLSVTYPKRYGK
jgi:hypothetical protein